MKLRKNKLWGLLLSMPYTFENMESYTIHTYNEGGLIACFDENIPDTVIKEIGRLIIEEE